MKKLSDAELTVMNVLWQEGIPMRTGEIAEKIEDKEWSMSTIQALLSRLAEKEAIYIEKQGKFKLYHPLITQRDYQKVETADFYHLVHRHSVKSLFSSLIDAGSLNKEDLDELKKIIEQVKE
ncbi:MAG: BlaI/MecI/CopY family transcriptional regulator [Erysipelotrichaceae bacterium]|nr:BlaI/MecI/CopY family transcriptional regulator [Erysipelotrichaceae bacterium]MBQ7888237.1 BlaI/MecI/CopY family transcriptional regulator [Erysipelotrichaceae bacterium]